MPRVTTKKSAAPPASPPGGSDSLNFLDVVYVIDTTGSMEGFIDSARRYLLDITSKLANSKNVSFSSGICEYKDFGDRPVYKLNDLTLETVKTQAAINGLRASGGDDTAEAVYSGLMEAVAKASWRSGSQRFIVLVGDAPPHGYVTWHREFKKANLPSVGDSYPAMCKSGFDPHQVSSAAENKNITMHGIVISDHPVTAEAWKSLCEPTGGTVYLRASMMDVMEKLTCAVTKEIDTLDMDRQIYHVLKTHPKIDFESKAGIDELAVVCAKEIPGCTRERVATAIGNLFKRGIFASSGSIGSK